MNTIDEKFRAELAEQYGDVYDTDELLERFTVEYFAYYLCFVTRKCDGVKGILDFTHSPRFYFGFKPIRS